MGEIGKYIIIGPGVGLDMYTISPAVKTLSGNYFTSYDLSLYGCRIFLNIFLFPLPGPFTLLIKPYYGFYFSDTYSSLSTAVTPSSYYYTSSDNITAAVNHFGVTIEIAFFITYFTRNDDN